ncbi:MAG: hypothetical protein NTZ51_00160, partial [Proteobacteria bacterium]|nr:hypothetical protein [Pseudomonadota bacterium]
EPDTIDGWLLNFKVGRLKEEHQRSTKERTQRGDNRKLRKLLEIRYFSVISVVIFLTILFQAAKI